MNPKTPIGFSLIPITVWFLGGIILGCAFHLFSQPIPLEPFYLFLPFLVALLGNPLLLFVLLVVLGILQHSVTNEILLFLMLALAISNAFFFHYFVSWLWARMSRGKAVLLATALYLFFGLLNFVVIMPRD